MTDDTLNRLSAANPFRPATTWMPTRSSTDRAHAARSPARGNAAPSPAARARAHPRDRRLRAPRLRRVRDLEPVGRLIGGPTVKAEYAAAQKQLTLPPGYTWPALNWPPHSVTSRGAGGSFAVANDQEDWECYWVAAIKEGDTAAQERAHAALVDLMTNHIVIAPLGASEDWSPPAAESTPTMVYARDGGYHFVQRMYALAAAGKPGLLAQSCRANGPAPGSRG